ncbi:MAG: carbon-nitrogen hydrolase [Bdellovibrionales bacterium]|nr:carbon-nitrogen hydrolase [Bdellovibrionales bacterium]
MSEQRVIRVGLVQMAMDPDAQVNRDRAVALVAEAAGQGAQVICLPELFTTPYFPVVRDAKSPGETIPGPTSRLLAETARKHGVVLVGGSIYERDGDRFYNTALIFDDRGELVGKYRKIHIPQDECFFEKDYFTPGDLGYLVTKTRFGSIGVLICYDQWYPEAARMNALLGANMVFYPTAIGTVAHLGEKEGPWQEAWENVQRGHAIANGMVVAAANRVGIEGDTTFWGGSFICDAFGQTKIRAGAEEGVIVQDVDLDHGEVVREGWGFLRNRRPDSYNQITE